jgi:hypothetical protein
MSHQASPELAAARAAHKAAAQAHGPTSEQAKAAGRVRAGLEMKESAGMGHAPR